MKHRLLGNAFSDSVISESKQTLRRPSPDRAWWQGTGRILLVSVILWVGLFILVARLFQLSIVDGYRFRALADENRTKELIRHAPRGILIDRTGKPLVTNIPRYRLLSPCKDNADNLCVSRVSREDGDVLQKNGMPPFHFLEIEYRREYMYPEATAHVVGYTAEIGERELGDEYYALRKYLRGDHIGKTGSEAVYEEMLRGRDGKELVEVDASGKILRVLGRDPELAGETIGVSIDAEFSQKVMEAFPQGAKGAVIVSVPQTGEIIALYSSPTFSLNDFSRGLTAQEYATKIDTPDMPLFDRAIGGIYPPGSTYKIVTAIAGLETGAISEDTKIEDTGVITIGPFRFTNWYFNQYGKTDGMVDLTKALARSNDIYFYKAGESIGITNLMKWSKKVGVGGILGIQLPGEAEGLLPGPIWKNAHFSSDADKEAKHNEWYLGDTYHMSIGQGYLLTTPLQVNAWTNVIANGGYLCAPTIESASKKNNFQRKCVDVSLKKKTIDLVTEGMRQACAEGGTAYPLIGFSISDPLLPVGTATPSATKKTIPIACKTGTAEFGSAQDKTHAWITLFAPIPDSAVPASIRNDTTITGEPEISVTVLVEEGGEGSQVAAPIAKKILEAWFQR